MAEFKEALEILPDLEKTNKQTECPVKIEFQGLPFGPVLKNPPPNAGGMGSIPGWGTKIPTCRGATKPAHHNY